MIKRKLTTKEFLWTSIIFWAASFTAIEAPITFVFHREIRPWQLIADIIISAIFLSDFIYHLKQRKKIQRDIDQSHFRWDFKLMLAIDLFSAIPIDLLSHFIGYAEIFLIIRLLRFIRIFKVFYLIDNMTIVPLIIRIQSIFMGFLMVVNWITCGWIMVYPMPLDTDTTSYYIKSFYWALTTLTTVGYGDITPHDNHGRLFTCFIMIIGVGMYGVIIGSITRIIANLDKHKDQSREKINDLILFMKHYNVPIQLQDSAINHYGHIFSKRLSDNDEKIIADLPHALQLEMQIYMKIKLISSISIFYGCSHECLKDVATNLEQIYSSPDDLIIKAGDIGSEMFIISHGSVDIFINPDEKIATLSDGQIFGETALIKETTRNANVQSKGYCDLYKLTLQKFNEIVVRHPHLLSNIEKTTTRRSTDRNS